tara:strand:- start:981 stop:1310 length:330 start_codon:yes stop_codon:yes gene_type:complete
MLKIVCNNIPRLAIHFSDLPAEVQAEFGHVESKETADYLLYKGEYYCVGEFISSHAFNGNDKFLSLGIEGYTADSAFSGIIIKSIEFEPDYFIIGQWLEVTDRIVFKRG